MNRFAFFLSGPRAWRGVVWLTMLTLTGCAGLPGDFHCNKTATDSCETISHVNQRVTQGDFSAPSATPVKGSRSIHAGSSRPGGFALPTPSVGALVRGGEQVQRIWIGPWQDKAGNYHEPAFVYTVLAPAHWVGPPPVAIQQSDDGEGA